MLNAQRLMTFDTLLVVIAQLVKKTDFRTAWQLGEIDPAMAMMMRKFFWQKLNIQIAIVHSICDCRLRCFCDNGNDGECYINHGDFSCISDCDNRFYLLVNDQRATMMMLRMLKQKGVKKCTIVFIGCDDFQPRERHPWLTDDDLVNIAFEAPPVKAVDAQLTIGEHRRADRAVASIINQHKDTLKKLKIVSDETTASSGNDWPATDAALIGIERLEYFCYSVLDHPNPAFVSDFVSRAHIDHWSMLRFERLIDLPEDEQILRTMEAMSTMTATSIELSFSIPPSAIIRLQSEFVVAHLRQLHYRCDHGALPTAADMAAIDAIFPSLQLLHFFVGLAPVTWLFEDDDDGQLTSDGRRFFRLLASMPARRYLIQVFIFSRRRQRHTVLDALPHHVAVSKSTVRLPNGVFITTFFTVDRLYSMCSGCFC